MHRLRLEQGIATFVYILVVVVHRSTELREARPGGLGRVAQAGLHLAQGEIGGERGQPVVVRAALFGHEDALLVVARTGVFVAQAGRCAHLSHVQHILREGGHLPLVDAAVRVGQDALPVDGTVVPADECVVAAHFQRA